MPILALATDLGQITSSHRLPLKCYAAEQQAERLLLPPSSQFPANARPSARGPVARISEVMPTSLFVDITLSVYGSNNIVRTAQN